MYGTDSERIKSVGKRKEKSVEQKRMRERGAHFVLKHKYKVGEALRPFYIYIYIFFISIIGKMGENERRGGSQQGLFSPVAAARHKRGTHQT